jgi:hypothetical protein
MALVEVDSQHLGDLVHDDDQPDPALKPVRTGSEMKLATTPSRRADVSRSMAPTKAARVAAATSSESVPPLSTRRRAVAVRMAMVEVVVTLSGRDVPMIAYTMSGTSAV